MLECVIMWNHYAFVHFADLREAKIALKHLHGHMFNGKNLIVQLSTSSNRPLPKCLAFNNTNRQNANLNANPVEENLSVLIQENRKLSSILCYRANESSSVSEKQQSDASSKDWINMLKTGNVPVQPSMQQNSNEVISESSSSYKNGKNETYGELVSLSGIPTPLKPDLSSKIPSSNKKIIQNPALNNINNYGYLNLETVKSELKRISSLAFKMEPVCKRIYK